MRRAKIVCTLGPSTSTPQNIQELVAAGMDLARFNLSHGDYPFHEANYRAVREAGDAMGRAVGTLVDLQGPKIRTGRFKDGPILLKAGDHFTITTRDVEGDQKTVGTTYKGLTRDVSAGDRILIDDGKISLSVHDVTDTEVRCVVIYGGPLSNNKGINLPGVPVSVPALSEKDEADLRWAIGLGVDFIALSFVRSAKDVERVHRIMDEEGQRLPVIAKIEKPQAVQELEAILDAFDGIMVARGDLGVEMPLEEVPVVQKRAIEMARRKAKPVIVATQVLESMMDNSRPTRAEASDAANAVLDGADAVMLSGETSIGAYPIEALQTMSRIILATERQGWERISQMVTEPRTRGGAITRAAVTIARQLDVQYLTTFTQSGDTARRLCRLRPQQPILAFAPDPNVVAFCSLLWGVQPILSDQVDHTDEMTRQVDLYLQSHDLASPEDLVVICAGSPPGVAGSTNLVKVHRVGDANDSGATVEDSQKERHESVRPWNH